MGGKHVAHRRKQLSKWVPDCMPGCPHGPFYIPMSLAKESSHPASIILDHPSICCQAVVLDTAPPLSAKHHVPYNYTDIDIKLNTLPCRVILEYTLGANLCEACATSATPTLSRKHSLNTFKYFRWMRDCPPNMPPRTCIVIIWLRIWMGGLTNLHSCPGARALELEDNLLAACLVHRGQMAEARRPVPLKAQGAAWAGRSHVRFESSNPYMENDIHKNIKQVDAKWHKHAHQIPSCTKWLWQMIFGGEGPSGMDEAENGTVNVQPELLEQPATANDCKVSLFLPHSMKLNGMERQEAKLVHVPHRSLAKGFQCCLPI